MHTYYKFTWKIPYDAIFSNNLVLLVSFVPIRYVILNNLQACISMLSVASPTMFNKTYTNTLASFCIREANVLV